MILHWRSAALGADPAALLGDLNLLGFVFESLVVRDLRVYSQPLGGEVRQYLDNKGLEVDAIIQTKDTWAAFEVKLGGEGPIDEAASSLLKFAGEIDVEQERGARPAGGDRRNRLWLRARGRSSGNPDHLTGPLNWVRPDSSAAEDLPPRGT